MKKRHIEHINYLDKHAYPIYNNNIRDALCEKCPHTTMIYNPYDTNNPYYYCNRRS